MLKSERSKETRLTNVSKGVESIESSKGVEIVGDPDRNCPRCRWLRC